MPSFLSKMFNVSGSADASLGATRRVDLSGNYFSFAMPENFSSDMPAEDLVEVLDISHIEKFDNSEYGNLIRRWWDIKKPGFFGKNLGTVMMDISVQRTAENKQKKIHSEPYDISKRLDFLLMIDDVLHQRYDELVAQTKDLEDSQSYYVGSFAQLSGRKLGTGLRDRVYNNQKWIGYSVVAPVNQLITGLITPLTEQLYLEVVLNFAPDANVFPREFREFAYQKTELIENSLQIAYAKDNSIQIAMKSKDWLKLTNDQVLERNREQLLIPLFGPNIHEQIVLYEQQAEETMKLLAKQDEKSE